MKEKHKSASADLWFTIVIVGRVAFMIGIWLLLFLMLFLGYFTVPIILIGGITLVYMLSDFGMVYIMKRQKKAQEQRKELIEQITKDEEQ